MHEYEMKFMANDHQRQLQAEAQRARLARVAPPRDTATREPHSRGTVRLSLASLLRRPA